MSAFIVSHKHIDALVSAMLDARMSYLATLPGLWRRCNSLKRSTVDYQSCETEDRERSMAWRICQAFIANATARLPGYAAAAGEVAD